MKPIKFNSKNYQLVSSWDDLTRDQFLKLAYIRTAYINIDNEREMQEARIILFQTVCTIPLHKTNRIEPDQWVDLLPHIDFLMLEPKLTKNPLLFIRVSFRTVIYAPVGFMSTSTISEFISAEDAFIDFMNNKNTSAAWLLLAILYRRERSDIKAFKSNPEKWNKDVREPFNMTIARENAINYSKKLPAYYATAVVLFFEALRTRSFVNNKMLSPLFSGSGSGTHSSAGWIKTLLAQSGKKFGDFDQTANQNWLVFMLDLANEMEKNKQKT